MNARRHRRGSRAARGLLSAPALLVWTLSQACGGEATIGADEGGAGEAGAATTASGGSAGTEGPSAGAAGRSGSPNGGTGGSISVDTAGSGGAPEDCGATALEAAPPEVNVLLVVDKSSSMNATDEFPEGRWKTLGSALAIAMQESQERIAFGLEVFPFSDDLASTPDHCEMPAELDVLIPIATKQSGISEIVEALAEYEPAGGTPTAEALARAFDYFTSGAGRDLGGDSYVLLATDGGPNCNAALTCEAADCTINRENPMAQASCGGSCCDASLDPLGPTNCVDDDRTVARVEELAEAGIKTLVVGIPGSQFFSDTLDRLAEAGLAPNAEGDQAYYRVNGEDGADGLADVLTRITTGLITTCRLQLTSTPPARDYEGLLNVEIDGQEVPQAGDDGWDVDRSTDPPTVVLKGATCEHLETEGAEQVTITYGCPTVVVPR